MIERLYKTLAGSGANAGSFTPPERPAAEPSTTASAAESAPTIARATDRVAQAMAALSATLSDSVGSHRASPAPQPAVNGSKSIDPLGELLANIAHVFGVDPRASISAEANSSDRLVGERVEPELHARSEPDKNTGEHELLPTASAEQPRDLTAATTPTQSSRPGRESRGRRRAWLLSYARPHWCGLVVISLSMAASVGFSLVGPWPTKILVDHVLGNRPLPHTLRSIVSLLPGPVTRHYLLVWVAIATIVVFLANTLLTMVQSYVSIGVRQRMTYGLGADLFLHLQRLSLGFHSRRPLGDTIARVTGDPACVSEIVLDALLPMLQSLALLATMFAVMWQLEPHLTLVSLAIVPFLALLIRAFGPRMKKKTRARRDLEGQMMSVVQETLSAIPVVQAFTREDVEHARFRRYAASTVAAYKRANLSSLWFTLIVGLCTAVGTAAVIGFGGSLVIDGRMTTGTLLVFLAYLASLYAPLNTIAYTGQTISTAFAQADRVRELLDVPTEIEDAPGARATDMRGVIRYEDVTFGYEPDLPVLRHISFEARADDVIAIVGPTGAGKTTLVNLLVRFADPWLGRISVAGKDLRSLRFRSVREGVAMVLQEPFIFPYSVAENIAYGRPDATREQIQFAAEAANAHEFIVRLADGYDTVVGERGATLSGGEKQRLSIARAFLKDAPVLVLDEPTSALDARTEALLLEALDRLMKGRLTLVIAHRLSTIRNATRILVLDRGRIIEEGRHDELMAIGGLYSQLYRQQVEIVRHDAEFAAGVR